MHQDISALALRLYDWYRQRKKGALWGAVHIAARSILNLSESDCDSFLAANNIPSNASADDDYDRLKDLGMIEVLSSGMLGVTVDKAACHRLIMAAATILLFHIEEIPAKRSHSQTQDSGTSTRALQNLTLALVLKGTDLEKIESNSRPPLIDVETMLEKASYFACATEQNISLALRELDLDEQAVDRQSEQQVLVPLNFQQYERIPPGGFASKLELVQYLRQGAHRFVIGQIRGIARSGGLVKLGFVRV